MTRATIHERGNGWAAAGDYVAGDDGELYRITSIEGPIHTGGCGAGNYVYAMVEWCDWADITDEEADNMVCSATIGDEDEVQS